MNAETLGKATEPFFSTKELGKGTGLGLSMVHGLALQLGGVYGSPAKWVAGTRAELWLPATTASAQSAWRSQRPEPKTFRRDHSGRRRRCTDRDEHGRYA